MPDRGDPDHDVVTESHDRCARDCFDHAVAARKRRRTRIANVPFAFGHKRERGVIGDFGWGIELERRDIRIGSALKRGYLRPGIIVASTRSQPRKHIKTRGICRVGGDVGNCR